MVELTDSYIEARQRPVKQQSLRGTIDGMAFGTNNILAGSVTVTNQIAGTGDIAIGTATAAELSITLLNNLNLQRGSLYRKRIELVYGLYTDEGLEEINVGTFYVNEANWGAEGVRIIAYDAMSKLDKKLDSYVINDNKVYQYARGLCEFCGVRLGQTEEEIDAMTNGTEILSYTQKLQTAREAIAGVAALLGAYATIGRDNKLYFKQFKPYGTVDSIYPTQRLDGGTISDFVTQYSELDVANADDHTVSIYFDSEEDNNKLIMDLKQSPYLQGANKEQRRQTVFEAIKAINYTPFSVTIFDGPIYDLGDLVYLPDGIGDDNLHCITRYAWTYGRGYELTGDGKNPAAATSYNANSSELNNLYNSSASGSGYRVDQVNRINDRQIAIRATNEINFVTNIWTISKEDGVTIYTNSTDGKTITFAGWDDE